MVELTATVMKRIEGAVELAQDNERRCWQVYAEPAVGKFLVEEVRWPSRESLRRCGLLVVPEGADEGRLQVFVDGDEVTHDDRLWRVEEGLWVEYEVEGTTDEREGPGATDGGGANPEDAGGL